MYSFGVSFPKEYLLGGERERESERMRGREGTCTGHVSKKRKGSICLNHFDFQEEEEMGGKGRESWGEGKGEMGGGGKGGRDWGIF